MAALDRVGNPIQPGSYIVYSFLLGQSAALKVGKVLRVWAVDGDRSWQSGQRIRVVGVEKRYGGHDGHGLGYVVNKPGTLMFPDRCLVIPEESLDRETFDLLKDVEVVK
jgi:hypothetical protein